MHWNVIELVLEKQPEREVMEMRLCQENHLHVCLHLTYI